MKTRIVGEVFRRGGLTAGGVVVVLGIDGHGPRVRGQGQLARVAVEFQTARIRSGIS